MTLELPHELLAPTTQVDIMPTLASFIGLNVPPEEIDGRCVDVIAGKASNCR